MTSFFFFFSIQELQLQSLGLIAHMYRLLNKNSWKCTEMWVEHLFLSFEAPEDSYSKQSNLKSGENPHTSGVLIKSLKLKLSANLRHQDCVGVVSPNLIDSWPHKQPHTFVFMF